MVGLNYLIQAEVLITRIKKRLDFESGKVSKESPTEMEVEGLFNWIIGRLHSDEEKNVPALENYWINLELDEEGEKAVLEHGKEKYYPKYVEKEKFYIVMEKVALIFNYMENFRAKYEPPKKIEGMHITNASLDIYISIWSFFVNKVLFASIQERRAERFVLCAFYVIKVLNS